ncbi:restriction endonuclease subunit S [Rubripirellula sp.]|nr:restriction endonuclease subunit S [Rubripirellula sp.]
MTLYPRIRIGDVVTIKGGKRLRPNEEFSSEPTQHPYIRARDVGEGIVKIRDAVYLPEDVANRLSRYRVTTGDVCITIVGANVGEMGIVPPNLDGANLTENCVRLTNNGKVTQGFLRYSLLGDDAQGQMKVLAGGAAQPKLGIYKIETVEIPLPSVPTQRKIASILSAYDDLIENNTRRIAILEEMAQAIYREWFVNFRFPGHENVKLVDSPLGQIPEGWELLPMNSVCSRITDGAHRSPKSVDEGLPMASVKDMEDWRFDLSKARKIDGEEFAKLVKQDCKPLKGDVLIAKDGSYLKHAFVAENELEVVLLSSIAILRPNGKLEPHLLTFILREPQTKGRLANYVSGVAIPRIILKDFARFEVIVPPESLQQLWWNHVQPAVELIHCLLRKNDHLRTTRDLLLPKLISGKLDVEDLDIDTGLTAEALEEATA